VILNKVLPDALSDPGALATAEAIEQRHAELAATLAGPMKVDEAVLDRVLLTVTESYSDFAVVARREAAARERFASEGATLITIPNLEGEISDMTGLGQLGGYLFAG